jgi:hypothetical protein
VQTTSENIFLAETKPGEASRLIVDESLETRTASLCELLVALDSGSIQLALKEKKNNRILALETFHVNVGATTAKWSETLEQLSRNSHLLRNFEFSKAIVGVFTSSYTLIPDAIFKQGDEGKFLDFNFTENESLQKVFSRTVTPFHLKTVFGIEEDLHHEIIHLFEEPVILHLSSTLLEAAHLQTKGKKEKEIFLNVRKSMLDVMVLEGKKLLLMNSFSTPTADDVLYFSLMVCDQLELDPHSIQVHLAGEIEKESAKYKLLFRYFKNLQFTSRPGNVKYSYRFDKVPAHQHFSLFSLALCES